MINVGLFDSIRGNFFCPYCGKKIGGFQTKDMGCSLDSYEWTRLSPKHSTLSGETVEMHTLCPSCKEWVELILRKKQLRKADLLSKKSRTPDSGFDRFPKIKRVH